MGAACWWFWLPTLHAQTGGGIRKHFAREAKISARRREWRRCDLRPRPPGGAQAFSPAVARASPPAAGCTREQLQTFPRARRLTPIPLLRRTPPVRSPSGLPSRRLGPVAFERL